MRTVDALGKRCPVPVIELSKALPLVEVGDVVEVLADDEAARVDIPVWCRMKGQEYMGAQPRERGVAYLVKRVS
ncbi:MAG TPA: sulfurtransferase TusA family protein [Mycobacteriales bacterium]